jgi:general secretion pathway protein L
MASSLATANDFTSRFSSWWLAELSAMWRPLNRLLRRAPKTLTLDTSEQLWVLRVQKGVRLQELGRFDANLPEDKVRKKLGALFRKGKLRHANLTVLLPESRSLRRPLEMPAIAEPELRQALFFEIERQTPFQAEDVYYDYRLLQSRSQSNRLTIELIAAPRADLDAILGRVRDWGLEPSIVDVAARNAQMGMGVNLLKSDMALTGWSSPRIAAVLVAVCLFGLALYLPVYQLSMVDDSLETQVSIEGIKAKQALAKRAELEETVRTTSFLDKRKQGLPRELTVLNELTKALPDNTWLTRLSHTKDGINISGYSVAASQLISRIDSVKLFKNPTFSSPIVQDPQNKVERFDISFGLEGVKK